MNLGETLLARLASRQVLRKRPRSPSVGRGAGHEPPSASSSASPGRAQKKARLTEPGGGDRGGGGLPPGLGLDLGPEAEDDDDDEEEERGRRQQRREDRDGGGGADDTPDDFVPLDQASRRAQKALIKRLIAEEDQEHTCFFCDFVKRYDQEKRRVGGQKEVMLEGSYAYDLAIKYFQQNANFSIVKKAKGILDIYKVHVYDKAVRALGGAKPSHLPEPSLENIVEHILVYNYDQMSLTKEALDTARSTVQMFKSQAMVEGRANEKNARTILLANQQFHALTKEMAKLREARGIPDGPFVMDPQKVMAFADDRPIAAFRKDNEGLGIGGATATNTAAEAQRVTAQRPTFGGIARGDEEDEDMSGEREEDDASFISV
jgi:hypothetical protein